MNTLEVITSKSCENIRQECQEGGLQRELISGPISLWCKVSASKMKQLKLHATVVYGPQQHFCTVYRDADYKLRLGHFNLKNCKVVQSETSEKQFNVQLHVSEKTGLLFEAANKERAKEWKAALSPRIMSSSPALSISKTNRQFTF